MAVRSRLLLPDIAVRVASGEMEVVSRQALLEAMADAAVLQDMAGGVISVAVQRVPTGAPNEMVTISAMVEWRDRTDAKAQPETRSNAMRVAEEMFNPQPGIEELQPDEGPDVLGERETTEPDHPILPFEHDSPDGLDESLLQDEDVPESVR